MHYRMTVNTLLAAFLIACFSSGTLARTHTDDLLRKANDYLDEGLYYLALQEAESILKNKMPLNQQSLAYGIKGNTLLIMQRYSEAEESLLKAYELTEERQRKAGYANSLGVLYLKMQDKTKSAQFFGFAAGFVENDPALALKIKLNQMRIQSENFDLPGLNATFAEIAAIHSADERIRYYLNLASITKTRAQSSHTEIIQRALESAHTDSAASTDKSLRIEALDSLAEFYESQGKSQQALTLSELAASLADRMDVDDLMIQIEWRKGRIYQQQGRDSEALVAFGKAVDYVQAIRRDIPVSYEDGKSSFRKTLEPIYLGYTHQLLKKAGHQDGEAKQQTLLLARQTIELIKQSELEDFLGGRCLIEGMRRSELDDMDAQAAILYPIILEDRLELLVGIGKTIHQFSVSVSREQLRDAINRLSSQLRKWMIAFGDIDDSDAYQQSAEHMYRWMIAPIERDLERESIETLVIVPDGMMRLVPFAALFDGRKHLIEKYAVSLSPGMSLLGSGNNRPLHTYNTLLAGISKPGPAVEKISPSTINKLLLIDSQYHDQQIATRSLSNYHLRSPATTSETHNPASGLQDVQSMLSLPGVETELIGLKEVLKSTLLLNEQFTVANFYQQISNQSFDIVHIASHGFFSSDADKSFLMAYDDILKLDDLKSFLKKGKDTSKKVQLLTFSACETAEGDDRAPLGFTGAALKADARSALGSLWPISDEAASQLMISFYKNLMQHKSKAEALRQAQLELLKTDHFRHPSFWSPFVLVGNWL